MYNSHPIFEDPPNSSNLKLWRFIDYTKFVSMLHKNSLFFAAMWNLYLKSNEGVAIQTTFEKFKESFNQLSENIYIGTVKYIDYENDIFRSDKSDAFNFFRAFVHKRKSYSHENEYRAIIWDNGSTGLKTLASNESGIYVPVDLNILIEKIIVAPDSQGWFLELVQEMLKVYKLNKEVVRSVIDNKPPKFI